MNKAFSAEDKRRLIDAIREIGADESGITVRRRLKAEFGIDVSEPTVYKYLRLAKQEVSPVPVHETNGHAGHVLPDDRPAPADQLDYLSKLVRFASAVEAVGGIDVAQRLLDSLKQMKGALR